MNPTRKSVQRLTNDAQVAVKTNQLKHMKQSLETVFPPFCTEWAESAAVYFLVRSLSCSWCDEVVMSTLAQRQTCLETFHLFYQLRCCRWFFLSHPHNSSGVSRRDGKKSITCVVGLENFCTLSTTTSASPDWLQQLSTDCIFSAPTNSTTVT